MRETKIREAQGEAEAIITVQRALADGIKMLNEAAPSDAVVALKSLESFEKAADGRATKIIIPSQIQGVAGLATSIKELVVDGPVAPAAPTAPRPPRCAHPCSPRWNNNHAKQVCGIKKGLPFYGKASFFTG